MTRRVHPAELRKGRLATNPERSALLRRVRQKGTAPESAVQSVLEALGYAFGTNVSGLPGSPDIVISNGSTVVFVHGCFWHHRAKCPAASTPVSNAEFWTDKFAANMQRDRRNARELRSMGYQVITVWECQTKTRIRRAQLQRRLARLLGRP